MIVIKLKEITPVTWRSISIMFAVIFIAAGLRVYPLGALGSTLAWLTFYPAVMIVAINGGLWCGLMSTVLAFLIVRFLWFILAPHPFIVQPADWIGVSVFAITSTMISGVSEAMLRANRVAREAQQQAQAANRAKSGFLANMSHELRTPVTAILGYTQLMKRDASFPDEYRDYLRIIDKSGEHLLALINEILDITKIEIGRAVLELNCFNLRQLIGDIENLFAARVKAKELFLEIHGKDNLPDYVIGDEMKIRVILINLLGNAVKFTSSGGIDVHLSAEAADEDRVILRARVEDTGEGIEEPEIEKLFQYFVQTKTGKDSKSGTGLGLAISRDYARMMNGDITIESESGKGSAFTVTILLRKSDNGDAKSHYGVMAVRSIKDGFAIPRVLVVEDVEENRTLLVKLLQSIGIEVQEAQNGAQAVAKFQEWRPDFIWMDIRMPIMDGLEATKIIRSLPGGASTKIVALSAHSFVQEKQKILDAGCDDFVVKPYMDWEIFDAMKKFLQLEYNSDMLPQSVEEPEQSSRLDLTGLDAESIARLSQLTMNTDAEGIVAFAAALSPGNSALAKNLQELAKKFDYETIQNELDRSTTVENKL